MESYFVTFGEACISHVLHTPTHILFLEVLIFFVTLFVLDVLNVLSVMFFVPKKSVGFSHVIEGAPQLLVLGDSTAVGTGARDATQTLAGFLAHDFPEMSIVNRGVNGARTRAVKKQLESMEGQYEGIFISTGGNDVWAFTSLNELRHDLQTLLRISKEKSRNRVMLIFFGNEGSAPFFPTLLRKVLMWQTRRVLNVFRLVAHKENVPLIELFTKDEANPFVKDPKTFFALDGLHPSEAGYWEWYKRFWRLMLEHEGWRLNPIRKSLSDKL